MKVSAIVLSKNEEKNIERCLRSLLWTDEVILVDSGSIDKTISIAKKFGNVSIIETEWKGFSANKQIGIDIARNNWILWIDADEEVTTNLSKEIELLPEDRADAFAVHRKNFFMGKKVNYSGWGNDVVTRLFNK